VKVLAIEKERPGINPEDFKPCLEEEALQIWNLQQRDFVREVYFREDQSSAVLILECDSIQQANEVLTELPLVKNRLIEFEVIPLKPYPGFARLFS